MTLDMEVEDGEINAPTVLEGKVHRETLVETMTRRVAADGKLEVAEEGVERQVTETRSILVDDELLLTARTEADEARQVVEHLAQSNIAPAEIDVESFRDSHPEADRKLEWAPDPESDDLYCRVARSDDPEMQGESELDSSESIQWSFKNLEWDGRSLYGTITESGYVEIYRDEAGSDIGTEEFTRFVMDEVMSHTGIAE
jgi:hypothetical protein